MYCARWVIYRCWSMGVIVGATWAAVYIQVREMTSGCLPSPNKYSAKSATMIQKQSRYYSKFNDTVGARACTICPCTHVLHRAHKIPRES